jgi:hypothetical protein
LVRAYGEFLLAAGKTGERQVPFYESWVEAGYRYAAEGAVAV